MHLQYWYRRYMIFTNVKLDSEIIYLQINLNIY